MAKEKHRCEAKVYHRGDWHRTQCERNGVNFETGQWWCKQHTPSLITAKDEANLQQWRKESAERDAAAARRARREELRDECVDWLRKQTNSTAKRRSAAEIIRELDALDGKGE